MNSYFERDGATLYLGDCLDVLRELESESVDAVVTDPPAGIGFMNKSFDSNRGGRTQWIAWLRDIMIEALRVTKPGGHAFVWALPRTSHWTATALEDAGWEIREICHHLFGSGFPKSASISKHIDRMRNDDVRPVCRFLRDVIDKSAHTTKTIAETFGFHPRMVEHWAARDTDSQPSLPKWEQWLQLKDLLDFHDEMDAEVWRLNGRKGQPGEAWHEREVVGKNPNGFGPNNGHSLTHGMQAHPDITASATDAAKQWEGWGTALKPSVENWILCRKPLSESSVARNVLKHGTGAINIGASRVGFDSEDRKAYEDKRRSFDSYTGKVSSGWKNSSPLRSPEEQIEASQQGRFPANLLLSHHPDCQRVGSKRVKGAGWRDSDVAANIEQRAIGEFKAEFTGKHYADPDGYETVQEWECARDEAGNYICPVALLDKQSGECKTGGRGSRGAGINGNTFKAPAYETTERGYDDTVPGASRFFKTFEPDTGVGFLYKAKPSRAERNLGLDGMPEKLKLRDDLTDEQREYVYQELKAAGVEL